MFFQFCKKIIASALVLCLSLSLLVVPSGAAGDEVELTDDFLEYFSLLADGGISLMSDTSDAVITMTDPICDSTISVHAACSMSGAGTPDTSYRFLTLIMNKDTGVIVNQDYSDEFTATSQSYTWSYWYLEPETDYSVGFFLVDGSTICENVGVARSFTTPAQGTPVSNTFFPAIYSKLVHLANNQENMVNLLTSIGLLQIRTNSLLSETIDAIETVNETLATMYAKLYQIEVNTGQLVNLLAPSTEESALKEANKDTMQAVNDSLYANDSPTKVTVDDVADVAQIGSAAAEMFNSGVGVSSFFDAFNDVSLVSLFTKEAMNDIYAVNEVTTYGIDRGNQVVDYYSENLNKIKNFVGGDD